MNLKNRKHKIQIGTREIGFALNGMNGHGINGSGMEKNFKPKQGWFKELTANR